MKTLQSRAPLLVCGLALAMLMPLAASAGTTLTCSDIGGTTSGDDCTLSSTFRCTDDITIKIPGNFTISGTINCDGANGTATTPGARGHHVGIEASGDLLVSGGVIS